MKSSILDLRMQRNITDWDSKNLLLKKKRAAPLQACLFSDAFSAGPMITGWFGGVRCCSSAVSDALWRPPCTCDFTTCVWGADFFKPEWLAAVTQVTSLQCKLCDSHLTLLSTKQTHCLQTERGK